MICLCFKSSIHNFRLKLKNKTIQYCHSYKLELNFTATEPLRLQKNGIIEPGSNRGLSCLRSLRTNSFHKHVNPSLLPGMGKKIGLTGIACPKGEQTV